jgi:hypothetical protein
MLTSRNQREAKMIENDPLYEPVDAAEYLGGVPLATLSWWRHKNIGPKYLKIGRLVRYRRSHLDEYLAAAERTPSQAA